jgi:hypothetical protein
MLKPHLFWITGFLLRYHRKPGFAEIEIYCSLLLFIRMLENAVELPHGDFSAQSFLDSRFIIF